MKTLLRLKHYQLFLLLLVLPVLLQVIVVPITLAPSPYSLFMAGQLLACGLMMAVLLGWFHSIITGLQEYASGLKINVARVRFFTVIPLVYIFLLIALTTYFGLQGEGIFWQIPLIVCLHLFSMFCIFYCMYMAAKTLKSVELQRPASFSDFAGEFFLFWFFPIGVWILQPRINKIIAQPAGAELDIFSN